MVDGHTPGRVLTIGAVVPRSGRLAKLGEPLGFAVEQARSALVRVDNGARSWPTRVASRDSCSEPGTAARATAELIEDEGADVVVTLGGTHVLPAVADTCESFGTPCVTSTFPWQVFYFGRGATRDRPFRWTYHFGWGIDDIAAVFAEMWEELGGGLKVGCLWNDGPQGNWSREHFTPVATGRGHVLVDPAGYGESTQDFSEHVTAFLDHDVDVVTSAATAEDLALFRQQAAERALAPRLVTCSRWLTYPVDPRGADDPAAAKIATVVYWTPRHPHRSSLTGTTADELATAYERATGKQWLQPLGLSHALFEVAAHALATAEDPEDGGSVAAAIARTRLDTVAGTLDWNSGPVPNVARIPLAGGQWREGENHPHELAVVANAQCPHIPRERALDPLGPHVH